MNPLFTALTCIQLINNDPWTTQTLHIQRVGKVSYLTEAAQETSTGWHFRGTYTLFFDAQNVYHKVPCPNINWEKK